jgi:hypothetical protein
MLYILVAIIIIIIFIYVMFSKRENFSSTKKFKAPSSSTKLKASKSNVIRTINISGKNLLEKYTKQLYSIANIVVKADDNINTIQVPSFFNCNEKWPGCLPRPLFQGSCGSCWGFAAVTALSARFYLESCGNSGCFNYPQINTGSLDNTIKNINFEYGFKQDYLENMTNKINKVKNDYITKKEWMDSAESYQKDIMDKKKNSHTRHTSAQILVYMLDFQSLGSIDLLNKNTVKTRAEKTYDIWKKITGSKEINIKKLQESWKMQPLNLSAEKLIACCIDCMTMDLKNKKIVNNPACGGGSLEDAWKLLRDTGTTTTLCIGYNLDNYIEGDKLSSCRDLQGPYYSFCSGYKLDDYPDSDEQLEKLENSGVYPLAMPNNINVPWIDPQLFKFRARNAYTINNNMIEIQKEIMERGPVNTGFMVYESFQSSFGGNGLGGQKYTGKNPLGSGSNCLIYMKDPNSKEEEYGGHAITIVGWGTYRHVENNKEHYIPYWTCLNSWGAEWGHSGFPVYDDRNKQPKDLKGGGYFWMVRGINNCGIEENVTCGQPNIENISFPGINDRYGWGTSPPSTENTNIKFIPKLKLDNKELDGGSKLEILPAEEGGGTYVEYVPGCTKKDSAIWQIKSADIPSPFLMFWPKRRPIYCLGNLTKYLSETEKNVSVSDRTIEMIGVLKKIVPNPLLVIGDDENAEQVQVLSVSKNTLIVNRSVNFSDTKKHKKYSKIKVFPYRNLSEKFLKDNGFYECSLLN